ncbi:MAG: hypothetical protein RMX68_015565 [Aulosira sp. ZfuVER01]|nr:hypothetical protein [Aulosira sp. DedVER01a]MDZ8052771.1 hypothetical protein [Aulosira sp. ZfuCHP01]
MLNSALRRSQLEIWTTSASRDNLATYKSTDLISVAATNESDFTYT